MKVYDKQTGRLGNAIFRYLASSLFCILYGAERTCSIEECDAVMTDGVFFEWAEKIVNNEQYQVPYEQCYIFDGYFQHDDIYKKFKNELVSWIQNHPNDVLKTDGNVPFYRAIDIITNAPSVKTYDTVVHIRLEDFVICDCVIHPLSLKNILDRLDTTSFCFVCNKISNEIEEQYVDFFKQYYDVTIESNDVLQDYTIMRNAKTLVCSLSTLSWCAALFSNIAQTVYFPDYTIHRIHETFKRPCIDTIHYPFVKCTANELFQFLNETRLQK